MASKNISTGTPGAAKGGAYGKPDAGFKQGGEVSRKANIDDKPGTPGGRKGAPKGARWDQN